MASFCCEKTKRPYAERQNNAKREDAMRKDEKIIVSNGVFSHGVFSSFRAKISSFRVRKDEKTLCGKTK